MKVKVIRLGVLEDLVANEVIELQEGATVGDLIRALGSKYGENVEREILEGGQVRDHLRILINGRGIGPMGGLVVTLRDEDTVMFVVPVAGGGV